MSEDKNKAHVFMVSAVEKITLLIECILCFILVAGIAVQLYQSTEVIKFTAVTKNLHYIINYVASMIIAIELIRLIITQSFSNIIEILSFAIVRELIITERPMWELLIGVVCIASLFAIKKYLIKKEE